MTHLDEGAVQAFLDDQMPRGDRAAAAAHLVACTACREVHEELSRNRSLFATGMAALDVPRSASPAAAVPQAGLSSRLTPSLVRAAVLVLFLAAAAAAAVPGSPVRGWFGRGADPPTPQVTAIPVDSSPEPAAVTVAGTVRGPDGRPLAFAQVRVVGDTISGWTDEAGGFFLDGGPHDRWRLRATHPGYRPGEQTVVLPATGSMDLEFRLDARPGLAPDPLSRFEPFRVAYTLPALLNAEEVTGAIQRVYPPHLAEAGTGGEAVLRLWLDEEGRVARSVLAASSGHGELDSLALRVSRQMRFRPAMNRAEPVRVIVQIPVVFTGLEPGGVGPGN